MNNSFHNFFEYKPLENIFLSKNIYQGLICENGPSVSFYYSLHPEIFSIFGKTSLLSKIKSTARGIYENPYYQNLSKFEQFLLITKDSEFVPNLLNGIYDENIITEYESLLEKNYLSENEGYFSIKSGFIIFNPNLEKATGYNLKWSGTLNTPRFEIPSILTFKRYLENNNLEIKNNYFNFEKCVEKVEKNEILDTFYNVLKEFNSLKVYRSSSEKTFENFAYAICYPLYLKYHLIGLLPSFSEQNLSEILNPEIKKQLIH